MAKSRIKESVADRVIAFNNSSKSLGQRDDIDQLAIIALESGRKDYQDLFEVLPSLQELRAQSVEMRLNKMTSKKKTNAPETPKPKESADSTPIDQPQGDIQ